ncbi:Homoserine O-acetyltransferase [hydrothermal vent metagenome]|uniref:Homoserine O-acetyltransferase n=1 Tax=hydrothermal vent metagenome TaxID=652676 RepID=A0A3B1D5D6_9ZZZZ
MQKFKLLLIFVFISSIISSQSKQLFAEIGNLNLESGEVLYDCTIGYRTFGKMNEGKTNIVLFPTWFGGTAAQLIDLIGPGKLIDDTKYYVIAVDALGNGISSSPSNSELQGGVDFPEITIEDMVNSQYILLTKELDIHHLFAVIGGSMGSMQAFQWIVSYPDFVDKAVPYVCSPRRTTYDQLIIYFREEMILSYQELNASDTLINKMLKISSAIFGRSPEYIIEHVSFNDLPEYLEKFDKMVPSKTFTIDNYLCQLEAMRTHNIYKDYDNSVIKTAKVIKAKVFMIVSMTDHLVNPATSLELADVLHAKVLKLTNNCGHLAVGCELSRSSKEINKFLTDTL